MHPVLVDELVIMFKEMHQSSIQRASNILGLHQKDGESVFDSNAFITIETEGSHFIKTKYPIDLISLSPKFENSIPKLGIQLPNSDKVVDEKMIKQHNKFRMNHEAISQMLSYHDDYHFKPVVDRNDEGIWDKIEDFRLIHDIPKNKTWVMPAGDTREAILPNYPYVIEQCTERGYNFTGRAHIIGFDDKREV